MKKLIIVLIAILAVLGTAGGLLFFRENYVTVDGTVYNRDLTELDLSGTPMEDPETLTQLTQLKKLNLENTGITEEDYLSVQSALPECEIRWSVPFQGKYYSLDTTELTLSDLSQADLSTLDYLTQLETVDATACTNLEAIQALQQRRPECYVKYLVQIGQTAVEESASSITLSGISADMLAAALPYLPNLTFADVSGCRDYEALTALQAMYPNVQIRYTVPVCGQEWPEYTAAMTLEDVDVQELSQAIPYLPRLQTVYLTGKTPENEVLYSLKTAYPDVRFVWSFDLLGVTVSTNDQIIDLSNIRMESVAEVENALKYFDRLERVIMCDCGISNKEMDALGKRNPDIRFVWTVSLGHNIRLRTDATYFMPHQHNTKVYDGDLDNLKYCTDLICVDLGHQYLTDGSFLQYLTKVKYLIIGDTGISDISGCANMTELIYLEMFLTPVKDYSPLINCTKLEDLNIGFTYPDSVEPLKKLTWLKNFYFEGNNLSYSRKMDLIAAFPDTTHVWLFGDGSSTNDGWRELQNYYDMRDILGMPYMAG